VDSLIQSQSASDSAQRSTIDLTVLIPVFDEEESVGELHRQLRSLLATLPLTTEILFVDDGSRDDTLARLEELYQIDESVRVIALRRNFGKTAALVAGFREARGDIIITLDGDLQDDPCEIPRFLALLTEGYDLVVGWKRERHDPITKRFPSRIFNFVVSHVTGIPLHDFNCGFKAYRREVLDELKLYADMHRFIPVLASWKGYRVAELPVVHHPRRFGRSKFGTSRLLWGLLDFVRVLFLTRFLQRPLQLFGVAGLLLFMLGLAGGIYLAYLKLVLGQSIGQSHLPLLFLTVMLILFGTLVFAIGLIGEMQRHFAYRPEDEYSIRKRLTR
jgi:glycosyltransferase involved in cell wall biosynthesis